MKEKFRIQGLAGKKVLTGTIQIGGAKNAVLKAMSASILFKDPVHIKNVPKTEDVKKLSQLMSIAGINVVEGTKRDITISAATTRSTDLDHQIAQTMRASIVLTGPMLARYGKVSFPDPGGCVIGARPIDLTIMGFQKMGAKIEQKNNRYYISVPEGKLKGAEIFFSVQTVGGTETLMMAAVLAKGTTVLKNCALEPEIQSLARYLVSCGAKIKGIGTTTMHITGGSLLKSRARPYITIPDRIETGSFMLLGALCAKDLTLEQCNPEHVEVLTTILKNAGVQVAIGKNSIRITQAEAKKSSLSGCSIRTHEYPGFPTDLQAPMVAFLTQTEGESVVFETIYEGRFKYVQDLVEMGADITALNSREIIIKGSTSLRALDTREIHAYDIRAGFASVMAALVAKGTSIIDSIYYIDRGYEALEVRLAALGATIERISDTK